FFSLQYQARRFAAAVGPHVPWRLTSSPNQLMMSLIVSLTGSGCSHTGTPMPWLTESVPLGAFFFLAHSDCWMRSGSIWQPSAVTARTSAMAVFIGFLLGTGGPAHGERHEAAPVGVRATGHQTFLDGGPELVPVARGGEEHQLGQ